MGDGQAAGSHDRVADTENKNKKPENQSKSVHPDRTHEWLL